MRIAGIGVQRFGADDTAPPLHAVADAALDDAGIPRLDLAAGATAPGVAVVLADIHADADAARRLAAQYGFTGSAEVCSDGPLVGAVALGRARILLSDNAIDMVLVAEAAAGETAVLVLTGALNSALRYATIDAFVRDDCSDANACAAAAALDAAGIGPARVGFLEFADAGTAGVASIAPIEAYRAEGAATSTVIGSTTRSVLGALAAAARCLYDAEFPATPQHLSLDPERASRSTLRRIEDAQPWLPNTGSEDDRCAAVHAVEDGAVLHAVLSGAAARGQDTFVGWLAAGGPLLLRLTADTGAGLAEAARDCLTRLAASADPAALCAEHAGAARAGRYTAVLVGSDGERLRKELRTAVGDLPEVIATQGEWATPAGSYCTGNPLGPDGKVAFVYPGVFSTYPGVGRDLFRLFPGLWSVLDGDFSMPLRQDFLYPRSVAGLDRRGLMRHEADMLQDMPGLLTTVVTFGLLHTQLLRHELGVPVHGGFGYSLGESSMRFCLGVWDYRHHDEQALDKDGVFSRKLAGHKEIARQAWGLPADLDDAAVWTTLVVLADPETVRSAIEEFDRVYLTQVNAPREVVVAGDPGQCRALADKLGYPSAKGPTAVVMHCGMVEPEFPALVEMSLHPVLGEDADLTLLSTFRYDREVASEQREIAEHVAETLQRPVDFPRLVEAAYDRDFRYFIDVGPGASCTRWIDDSLAGRDHLAVSIDRRGMPQGNALARALARLVSHGLSLDLGRLFEPAEPNSATVPITIRTPSEAVMPESDTCGEITFDGAPFEYPAVAAAPARAAEIAGIPTEPGRPAAERSEPVPPTRSGEVAAVADSILMIAAATAQAHRALVSAHSFIQERALAELEEGAVTGPEFAHGGPPAGPDQLRLPYQLVPRITGIDTTPGSSATISGEYDIPAEAWYLVDGQVPAAVLLDLSRSVEILLHHLGVDGRVGGPRAYRLLGGTQVFHDRLPRAGQTVRFRAEVEEFAWHDNDLRISFRFGCSVDGTTVLELPKVHAGVFTPDANPRPALDAPARRTRATDHPSKHQPWFKPLARTDRTALSHHDLELLGAGRPGQVFGAEWDQVADGCNTSIRLASGGMRMLSEVTSINRLGGPRGLGELTAEYTVDPEGWYFGCAATLPEGLLSAGAHQLLQIYASYLGLHLVLPDAEFQPAPGIPAQLTVAGQVAPDAGVIRYHAEITDITYLPRPTVVADVTLTVRDRPIAVLRDLAVEVREKPGTQIGVGVGGRIQFLGRRGHTGEASIGTELNIAHAGTGDLEVALGPEFAIYHGRRAPHIPIGDYQFVDRIQRLDGHRGELVQGSAMATEYDSAPEAWYYRENAFPGMPNCVYLETSLQAAILLGYHIGATLTDPGTDFLIRNLDGTATVLRPVDLGGKTIRHESVLRMHLATPDAVLQRFSYRLLTDGEPFYEGESLFGFFTEESMTQQVGLDAGRYVPPWLAEQGGGLEATPSMPVAADDRWFRPDPATGLRLADGHLRLLDRATVVPGGGAFGKGYVYGVRAIDPDDWYFSCHFPGDPVMPGSLGVEAVIQALQLYVIECGLAAGMGPVTFEMPVGVANSWRYRGQILRHDKEMTVDASIKDIRREQDRLVISADANVWKPGLRIYQLTDIAVEVRTVGDPR